MVLSKRSTDGFTLAELLVVIAIVGILTILVMVNFQSGRRANELKRASTDLLQTIRLAQSYSIAGNSIKFCGSSATANQYKPCDLDSYCGGVVGSCATSVPPGGYGLNLQSPDNYTLFADTTKTLYFQNDGSDFSVAMKSLFTQGIHIRQFKLGSEAARAPSPTNILDVTFLPPVGTASIYLNAAVAQSAGQPVTTVQLLVGSDYITNFCRTVSINRISGQVSETQSGCSL